MVSHEMRTPLTSVLGNASLLLNPELRLDGAEGRQMLQDIAEEASDSPRQSTTCWRWPGCSPGAGEPIEPLALQDIVAEAIARHRRCGTHSARSTCGASTVCPLWRHRGSIWPISCRTCWRTRKSTHRRRKPFAVELQSRREQSGGPSSGPRDWAHGGGGEHIFEPFYRSARIAATSPGMGIGLSVCKRLVEEQGGRINAQPRPDGGAEFGFTLPLNEPREDDP